jgi:hypothetical protein
MNTTATLINQLIQLQGKSTDLAFSQLLDIPINTWRPIKKGKRRMGRKVISKVLSTYPELNDAVLAYLRNGND